MTHTQRQKYLSDHPDVPAGVKILNNLDSSKAHGHLKSLFPTPPQPLKT